MTYHSFQIPPKKFNMVVKAISPGLIHLVKSHSIFYPKSTVTTQSVLLLEGIDLLDKKCNSRHVCQSVHFKRKISSGGTFY